MMSTEFSLASEQTLQQVPGLSTRLCELRAQQETPWRVQSDSSVMVLCMQGSLRVDIDRPMYSADLGPGELYSVPANLAYRLAARTVETSFLLIVSGASADFRETTVHQQDREAFLRTGAPPVSSPFDGNVDKDFGRFTAGFTRVDVLAKTANLRVLILGLGPNCCVPWHTHDEIADTFFCMEGPMRVEVSHPDDTYVLLPGQTCEVPARRAHFVSGTSGNPCTFLIMQGIGEYNYVAFDPAAHA